MLTPSVPQGGKAGAEAGTTVAREMGDITACSLARVQVPDTLHYLALSLYLYCICIVSVLYL